MIINFNLKAHQFIQIRLQEMKKPGLYKSIDK